ncbi:NUDIX domain-containing protein [Paenibacillus periandrae]|uniref:NUDIX domain-containing protein n=1 Tax=Paenibacillus periandrae TaxID=1761741 RepID=UPI001F096B26|nr:NUDIX domain-containing protein [Paenibacillus periandrae]
MKIRNSAKAVIFKDNKLLVIKLNDESGIYYLLPGGGQEVGGKLNETLIRECIEETGYIVEVQELMFIRECFLDKNIHRVEFIFKCEISDETKTLIMDKNQIGYEWIDIDTIQNEPLFPAGLKKLIKSFSEGIKQ